MQFALCHGPIDALVGIQAGDPNNAKDIPLQAGDPPSPPAGVPWWGMFGKVEETPDPPVAYVAGSDPLKVVVQAQNLFGGQEKEGGIGGTLLLYRGTTTQGSDSYLSRVQGRTSPNYKGICYASMQQIYVGTSSYIKPLSFIVKRCPNPFADGVKTDISGDGNPALFVYELLTSTTFGLGIAPSKIARSSFESARDTLFSEGLGISMQIDQQSDADALIGEICRHMDAVVFTDPATGLWTIKLARADYDPATIPTLDVDSVLGTPDFSRGSWSETTNEIKIRFVDRAGGYKESVSIPVQDLANVAITGDLRSDTIDFRGISNPTTAALVAMRVLKTVSYPLSKLRLEVNRKAWSFRPGSVFKFTWTPLGIANLVFRVGRIAYGSLDESKITIDAIEDIFGISKSGFVAPPSGWTSPAGAPQPVANQKLVEVPYHFAQDGIRVFVLGVRGDSSSLDFEIWADDGGGYYLANVGSAFCPIGLLASDYGMRTSATDATGFVLQAIGGVDLSRLSSTDDAGLANGRNLALFENGEIVSWKTATFNVDGTIAISGVMRGVLDSVPQAHTAGERVWFITEGAELVREDAYPANQTVLAKLLPRTSQGTLAIGSASSVSLATASRAAKPYPPGDLRRRSGTMATFPNTIVGSGDFLLDWRDRDRIAQTAGGTVVAQNDATAYTREGNYTVQVKIGGVVRRTSTGVVVTTYTYTLANRLADDPDGSKAIEIVVTPVNGSLSGTPHPSPAFVWTGFGIGFGSYFGGLNS